MYPISFDNPNKGTGRNKTGHPSTDVPDGNPVSNPVSNPVAANRNIAENTPETAMTPEHINTAAANSLLVVECRRDDKWRVELCTDLSELDGALDMARAFRKMPDVDEVCLTLEVSGENGRESRREVLRFEPETLATQAIPAETPVSAPMAAQEAVTTAGAVGSEAMAVLNATLKIPDYDFDDLDFSEFIMPAQGSAEAAASSTADRYTDDWDDTDWPESTDLRHFEEEEPLDVSTGSASELRSRQAARELLTSIYRDDLEPIGAGRNDENSNAILVNVPDAPDQQQSRRYEGSRNVFGPNHNDWLDRTLDRTQLREGLHGHQSSQRHRLEVGDEPDDDQDAIERLEMPLFGQQNGLAGKLLVFAGTLALLVLGGALAELLAVDLTSVANAGVGPFDTLNTLQSHLSH